MKILITALILFSASLTNAQGDKPDPTHEYAVKELQEDFNYFRAKLEKIHPALYMYTPKKEMDHLLDSLYTGIDKPLTSEQFYHHITVLHKAIKDAHTMFLPENKGTNYYYKNDVFFPLDVTVQGGALFVNMNCSSNAIIKDGDEIIRIDEKEITSLVPEMIDRQIRDGNNLNYPYWILDRYFRSYYSFLYGHPTNFSLTLKRKDSTYTCNVNALLTDSIKYYRAQRYGKYILPDNRGISLENITDKPGWMLLTIKSFDNNILKPKYAQNFGDMIDSCFDAIHKSTTTKLIIDLRDNQGGDFKNGVQLLSYVLTKPIDFLPGSPEQKTIRPRDKGYQGDLYVMINGGSFSMSGIVSSYLASEKRAVFIGTETGGNATVICGNPRTFYLPHTRITAEISTTLFPIAKEDNNGHGTCAYWNSIPMLPGLLKREDLVKKIAVENVLSLPITPNHFCSK